MQVKLLKANLMLLSYGKQSNDCFIHEDNICLLLVRPVSKVLFQFVVFKPQRYISKNQ